MYIEKQREAALAKRKGATWRTILQIVWLGIWFAIGYFFVEWLYANEYLSPTMFIRALDLPFRVPEWVVTWGIVAVIVFVTQVFLLIGFMFANPRGRQKAGQATLYSSNPDPLDNRYHH